MLHLKDHNARARLVKAESQSSIASLALALSHHRDSGLNFMVMTAYFDESGTHGKDSPATVFGGFAANEAQWGQFEESLKALMEQYGIKHLHAKDFRQRRGDFSGMHLSFRAALLRALMFIVDNEDQIALVPILELGHRNIRDAARIYNEIKNNLVEEQAGFLGPIAFEEKKRCLPLAVADSLVYAAFRKTAGYTSHPHPHVFPTGPSDPPYYVSKTPVTRIEIDSNILDYLSSNLR